MAHLHEVRDADTHFTIDAETMVITNTNAAKNKLRVGDHNSEVLTFEIPRYIENHDVLLCDKIGIHYMNAGTNKVDVSKDVYWVTDAAVSEEDENIVLFSWLVSGNATKYVGLLSFGIMFGCLEEDNTYSYVKNTEIFSGITISDGYNFTEAVVEQYSDVLEQWKKELSQLSEEKVDKTGITLATHTDGLIYLFVDGKPVGIGLDLSGGGTSTGLSSEIKSALMTVVENIGLWKDGNGQAYIDNLRKALYNAPLSVISAVYTQSKTVYASDDLEVLKEDLVVTGTFTDGSSAIVTDYTLSGTLTVGTSIITVSKDGKTATFEVTVTASRIPATGITLNKTTLSFTSSEAEQLIATVEPSNTTDTVAWSSSENAVATVENGLVTPQADGSCKIYATAGDIIVECSVTVSLPLSGFNMGNPWLSKVNDMPPSGVSDETELQNKWYKASYNSWATSLGLSGAQWVYLHPLGEGTHYVRAVTNSRITPYVLYAFENADIGVNPTTTLGKVGDTYKDATYTETTGFEWVDYTGAKKTGEVNLGEYSYIDESGKTYTDSLVRLLKITVPKNVYVFLTKNIYDPVLVPGISENYPYMNDLYTIFESDPSANILQLVD